MLKTVSVISSRGERLDMPLARPEESGINIYNIEGIGAGTSNVNTTELATIDGSRFNSAKRTERNIVLYMRFLFDPMVEDVRHRTYQFFTVKSHVTLEFETDRRTAVIDGYVESNEPAIFEKDEYTQISIICPYPYFKSGSDGKVTTVFSGVEAGFEFPFSNESLENPLIIFGEIQTFTDRAIVYTGDADVGVTIHISATREMSGVIGVYNITLGQQMTIDLAKVEKITGGKFANTDEIVINSILGEKYIHLVRNGLTYNILGAIDKDSDWFTLTYGDNVFAFTSSEVDVHSLVVSIEHDILFEGV